MREDPAGRCAGVLLAAGDGSRMGTPKALLELDGRLLVDAAVGVLSAGGCDPVVVVLGAGADEVRRSADLSAVVAVDNPRWSEGQSTSLRTGLAALDELPGTAPQAAVLALVDQPRIGPDVVHRLVHAWRDGAGPAVVATYAGHPRNPVLLDRSVWAEVGAAAAGDEGARTWLRNRRATQPATIVDVECGDLGDPLDLDTPADLEALTAQP